MRKQLILLSLLIGVQVVAQKKQAVIAEKPIFISSIEGMKEYSLKNGMKVLLIPDASQSNMVVNIIYNVGSRHEGYGEKGMAHLLEHMLFKSTKKLGDIKKMLSSKGGNANGTTWLDRTNYYEIFPSSDENLKWSLEMEADRMINATILQEDLDKEFSVVRNEFEIGENNPQSVLLERLVSTAFLWHNYGNSTIGSKEDIERVKAKTLRVFYEKYYQPDNATLLIGGKFDTEKALEYIGKYFAGIKKPARVLEKTYTVEPAQDGERFVELKRSGDVQTIGAIYHTIPYAHKDFAAIDALTEILTSDPSGYLYKALVETQKASSLYAYQPNVRDASYLSFTVNVPKDKSLDEAKKIFLSELDNIKNKTFTQTDVDRAKSKLLKYIDNTKNNTINLTISLTEIIGAGDYRLWFLYRDAVEKLTLEDINQVAKKYFLTNNRTYGVFIPTKEEERVKPVEVSDDNIAALTQSYKGKATVEDTETFESSITNIKNNLIEYKLSSGLKYAVLKKPVKGKKVMADFKFPVGNATDLKNKSEVGYIVAGMLKAGTTTKSKEQIQDALDKMKSDISFFFYGQTLSVRLTTYEEFAVPTFDLLQDLLTNSVFPESEMIKLITEEKTNIEANKNDPQSVAFDEIDRRSNKYANDHIFYSASPEEKIASLNKIKREQLVDFYKTILGANNGIGTLIGNLDGSEATNLVAKTFGSWNSKSVYEKVQPVYFETSKSNDKINTPDKENAAVAGKISFTMNVKNADYPAMVMANEMLGSGGFLTSRIPIRLREKEGISYGAGSYLNIPTDNEVASLGFYAFFNPTKVGKVEDALADEIKKVVTTNGFTAEELKTAIVSWKNERKTSLGLDSYLLYLINTKLNYGTPLEDFETLEAKVDQLTADQINNVIKKYVSLDKVIFIYAGDFAKK
ncbi:M16 family metallopeptidase [Flavobacterium humi]|uniref:Insulinase family protein n=1 Tax=Flavobacterium humi TaxID=2562683 RepID=A0A4Z0LC28_9FLAO|nr:pitrilysin family protein [Flavobacterium humi]TGD59436.1 insulinase family protein [Flavobacterium humi]